MEYRHTCVIYMKCPQEVNTRKRHELKNSTNGSFGDITANRITGKSEIALLSSISGTWSAIWCLPGWDVKAPGERQIRNMQLGQCCKEIRGGKDACRRAGSRNSGEVAAPV